MQHHMFATQQLSDLKKVMNNQYHHEGTAQYMLLLFEWLDTSDSVSHDVEAKTT